MIGHNSETKRNLLSITSLLLGIVAFLVTLSINVLITSDAELALLFIPGLVIITIGLVCGHLSLRNIRHSNGMLGGRRTSVGGVVLGYSAILAAVVWTFIVFALPRIQFAILGFSNPPNYEVVLQLQETSDREVTSSLLEEVEHVMSSRLRSFGAPHRIEIVDPDQLIVRLWLGDASNEGRLLGLFQSKRLSFNLVHPDSEDLSAQMATPGFSPPDGYTVFVTAEEVLFVEDEPVLVNGVNDARVDMDSDSRPMVRVVIAREEAGNLARVTRENVGRRMAIVLDETLYSAPVILGPIGGGEMAVTGSFSGAEASDLALVLRSGAVPVPIHVIEGHFFE